MIFEQIQVGPMQNFAYIVGDETTKEGAVFDPGWEPDKILAIAEKHNLKIKLIFNTHHHNDHSQENTTIKEKTNAKILSFQDEDIEKDQGLKDQEVIKLGNIEIKVFHTPGHTPGAVCYLIDNKKLITGDTLFVEACGRSDLPGGDPQILSESLKKLSLLDETIEVYPGHDYGSKPSSTIGHEKKHNPFMHFKD